MEEPLTLLRGLRVVEVPGRDSGRIAGELLAALGADLRRVGHGERWPEADVVITSTDTDGEPHGRAVRVDISPYGRSGPCAGWTGNDTTIAAHAGLAAYIGEADREPLVPPVPFVSYQAGIAAACGALAALGHGPTRIEVAEFDVLATTHLIGLYGLAFFSGPIPRRAGRRKPAPYPFTHLPCADGWVCVAFLEGRHWSRFVEAMGAPEWAADERYRDRRRMGEQYPDEVDALVTPWLKTKTKQELLDLALERGLPIAPLRTVDEVLASGQLATRRFFEAAQVGGRTVQVPGLPFRFKPSGAHRADTGRPLAGLRVLDLGRVVSAPGIGQWLADLGADVIKVESRRHLDSARKGRPLLSVEVDAGDAGQTPNLMPFFLAINRGKRSIVLDLAAGAGREVFDRLLREADVLIENFGAGGLERFGLGPDHLHSLRPELVIVRVSAVGQDGPEASLPGYAPHSTAAAGLDDLCRYRGAEPVGMIASNFGDINTAAFGALAVLAAVRAGRGGTFDLSMLESNVTHLASHLLAHQLGQDGASPPASPADAMYRCAGDDAWIAVTGAPAGEDLGSWAAALDSRDAARQLQERGIAAAPVLGAEDLLFDDHVRSRDLVVEVPNPVLGVVPLHGVPFRATPDFMAVRGPAPDLDQHRSEILTELGYSAEDVARLSAGGAFDDAG